MKFLELTPAQIGCTGTLLVGTGMGAWIAVTFWLINWIVTHVRFL